jgi:hypothetical protein
MFLLYIDKQQLLIECSCALQPIGHEKAELGITSKSIIPLSPLLYCTIFLSSPIRLIYSYAPTALSNA